MVVTKLSRQQWIKLVFYVDDRGSTISRSSAEMKEHIKEKYNGIYNQLVGWGAITFEKEEHLTWFLLNI